jgi:SAM-dependent methyltransferase
MVDFRIDEQFDVIFCLFDSINHLRRLSDWKKAFAAVRRRLLPSGCFIFDINKQRKLERLIAAPPWVHRLGRNLAITDVTALPSGGSNWNVKVFKHLNGSRYVLPEENIVEVSFPLLQVVAALRAHCMKVRVIDPDRSRRRAKSERLFFMAISH